MRSSAFVLLLLVLFSGTGWAASGPGRTDGAGSQSSRVMVVRLSQNISLDELLRRERYSIDDAKMVEFLQEFLGLNSEIKSISRLKKGSTVRIPLHHVVKQGSRAASASPREEFYRPQTRIAPRPAPRLRMQQKAADMRDRAADPRYLAAIRFLFQALGKNVTIENEGMKVFQVGEQRDISLDASRFPMIDLHDERVVLLDLSGFLPREIRDIIEIAWPEYRVVTARASGDLKAFVGMVLAESGYEVLRSDRIVSGGVSQIEYRPDFFISAQAGAAAPEDLVFVSFLGRSERKTPAGLLSWFQDRGIRLVELLPEEPSSAAAAGADLTVMGSGLGQRELVRELLRRFGQPYAENTRIVLSEDKGVAYAVTADYLMEAGPRKKAIVLSGLSAPERTYASKGKLDMIGVSPDEKPYAIAGRVASLLAVQSSADSRANVSLITPKDVRYRLHLPGTFARLANGRFFVTDADIGDGLLKEIVAEGISVVKF